MAPETPDTLNLNLSIATDGSTISDSTINVGDVTGHDKIVQGDEVHGDKYVIHQSPKPRIPLQRPPRATHFQDRKDDLAQLLLDLQPGRVITLCGPGGIGKTALAAEAVWQLAPGTDPPILFPEGILFHSFYNQPQAAVALEHIARSFGEEPKPTPKEAAQRALAGRRVLLFLDGAEQADDLRLVLDIRDQCGVLVASRTRTDEVDKRQNIGPLPVDEAALLLQAWGKLRTNDKTAVHRIAELVGGLPLAVCLAGRYLAQREEEASEYVTWLAHTPLAALDHGQRQTQSIPALLGRSLGQVSELSRQVLGVVGLLALAPFDTECIVAGLKISAIEAKQSLGELVNSGLLLRPIETYEVTHTLIHAYTRERLQVSPATLVSFADYYKHEFETHRNEFNRLNRLRPHVIAFLQRCNEYKAWDIVNSLVLCVEGYFDLQGYWTDLITILEIALNAAQAMQNPTDEGIYLRHLGEVYRNLRNLDQSINHHQFSLSIARRTGDRKSEGHCFGNLGHVYHTLGQTKESIHYYQQALAIAREVNDRKNEGIWLVVHQVKIAG